MRIPETEERRDCNLLRPLIRTVFLLVPYGYIIIKIKRIPKEMTGDMAGEIRCQERNCGSRPEVVMPQVWGTGNAVSEAFLRPQSKYDLYTWSHTVDKLPIQLHYMPYMALYPR